MAWAFETVNHRNEKIFAALAKAAQRRLSEFNVQDEANTAWAFATVIDQDEKMFTAFARAAERRLSEFNSQGVTNTGCAFATVNHRDENFAFFSRKYVAHGGC